MVYLYVGIGGIAGAIMRYALSVMMGSSDPAAFPAATLITNLIGCFILGWLTTYLKKFASRNPFLMKGVGTGLIGSFTTFSTFSVESIQLIQAGQFITAFFYILLSLFGGLAASYTGYYLGIRLNSFYSK